MDYKSSANAYKMFTIVLVIVICIDAITAAPLVEQNATKSPKTKNTSRRLHKKASLAANGKKSGDRKKEPLFTDESVRLWSNPCDSEAWVPEEFSQQNYNDSKNALEVSAKSFNTTLSMLNKINTTNYEQEWGKFHGDQHKFLPTRPEGQVHKWHEHMQIYVASLHVLHQNQIVADRNSTENRSEWVSSELKQILDKARALLCDIEHFVNATSNKNGRNKPYWFSKQEMTRIVNIRRSPGTSKTQSRYVSNIYVKGRLENYLDKLYRRIKKFNLEKNLETKSYRPHAQPRRNHGNKRRRTTATPKNFSTTEKMHIVRTVRKNGKNKVKKNIIGELS